MKSWGIFLAVLVAAGLAVAGGARPAFAASVCAPSRMPITLDFTTKAPPPVYNNRLTVAGIRKRPEVRCL